MTWCWASGRPARRGRPGAGTRCRACRGMCWGSRPRRRPGCVRVTGVPNARLAADLAAVRALDGTADQDGPPAADPEDFYVLGAQAGYQVAVTWSAGAGDGRFDVVFTGPGAGQVPDSYLPAAAAASPLTAYASRPLGRREALLAEVREHAGRRLPEFMIPSVIVELTSLPLTPNGKVDRAALPAPSTGRPEIGDTYAPPRGAVEELLAGIWAQVLGLDRAGAGDNFFALGGHSLLATRVISRVREVFGTEVPVAALFDHPTVAGLAAVIAGTDAGVPAPPVEPAARDQRLPLSFAQQRLWFLAQMEPGSAEYNVPSPVRMPGAVDVAALGAALSAITARHEVLRTRLVAGADGVPFQVIDPPSPFPLTVADVSGAADPRRAAGMLVAADAVAPFDLAAGPVIRACLARLAADGHVLVLSVHHAAFDEWSAGIFKRELAALHAAFRAGQPDRLPPLGVQYADFAVWQRAWLAGEVLEGQLAYWRGQLAG